jgi:hypothetical protein
VKTRGVDPDARLDLSSSTASTLARCRGAQLIWHHKTLHRLENRNLVIRTAREPFVVASGPWFRTCFPGHCSIQP